MAVTSGPSAPRNDLQPENYRFLQDYIYRESGIVIDSDKHYLLEARLLPIARQQRIGTLNDLCALLRATGSANGLRRQVVEAMTTHETLWFRDPGQYDALRDKVLPDLLAKRQHLKRLRMWSAASSSGQEAYSLAIMLLEMNLGDWNIEIIGTDLSEQILDKARQGRYLQIEVNRGLPVASLVKYFNRSGLDWQLNDKIRSMVRFQKFDLRDDMRSLGSFDVIFCRNVLIYFDHETKRKILTRLYAALQKGGCLLLGGAETTLNLVDDFERVAFGSAVLYRVP
ncbi:MAG: protein-glutamate O-methyltransferase CheR [Bryobacterales bacterium]|nr:protein-glutamate O-methyltransferase CheR [Bryobacterales bacterium]